MAHLRAWGYAVQRSAQSHGPADLMAGRRLGTGGAKVLAVQAKGGSSRFGVAEAQALVDFAACFDAVPLLYGAGGAWYVVAVKDRRTKELLEVTPEWFQH